MYNCKDVIDSLGMGYTTYMAEGITGYEGDSCFSEEDFKWWSDFVEENGIPNYSLADYLNASRIMGQAITIYNDPEILAKFSFSNGDPDMKYYFDFPDRKPPYTWELILSTIYENFPVVKKVFVDPTKYFLDNVDNPNEKYKEAKIEREKLEWEAKLANLNENNKNNLKPGVVYLLKIKDKKQYKIGVSNNFKRRYNEISPKMPFELKTINLIKSFNIYDLEKELHERFSDKRIKGEWFELEPEDVEYIKSIEDDDIDA